MKLTTLLLFLTVAISSFGQSFEIPSETYPFYDIIEWKGQGALLLNRDPAGVTKKVNLTLVGNSTTSIWQQSFNPNGKDFYYISSENARYVYFLDHLQLESGKISLHQLSSAGNVKSTSVALGPVIKKMGYEPTEVQLTDVITTDKALIHVFRHFNKKEGKYTELATFVTHHNFLVYGAVLGESTEIGIKDATVSHWKYVGFNGDNVYFAARDNANKKSGWAVKSYTSKAELKEGLFVSAPTGTFETIRHTGLGSNGRKYLAAEGESESLLLMHQNGKFFVTGIRTDAGKRQLELYQQNEGKWTLVNSAALAPESSKKTSELGIYPLNEGIGCKLGTALILLPYSNTSKAITAVFNPKTHNNPSRWLTDMNKEQFAVSLGDSFLFFDLGQLNKAGGVKFELKKK